MKIAMVSAFAEAVPPKKYGGIELVVSNITEHLVEMGHDVTLFAPGKSKTRAKFVQTLTKPLRAMSVTAQQGNALIVTEVGKLASTLTKGDFDIIHNHIGWRLLSVEKLIPTPIITTLHGPLNDEYQNFIYSMYKKSNFASISLSQRRGLPSLNFVANVYNGIEVPKFKFSEQPKDYFAFLGRMSPEKGPVQAIQIAKKAGVKLIMAAKVDAVDNKFFTEKVKPLIDGKQIKFIGEVDHAGKVELLSQAQALIAPIQWEEPFGLFFVEAMACGAPVISMKRGSVPEIVIDKKTGFVCTTVAEAAAAVKKLPSISRRECRTHVEKKFSATKMTLDYVEAYKKIIKKKRVR